MKGYYSLIQYAENPDRVEYVNIGVVIFSDYSQKLKVKFADNASRIKKAFGVNLGSKYGMLTDAFTDRLNTDFSDWNNLSDIEYFVANKSTKIRMTPLRAILLKDLDEDINLLFNKMVGMRTKVKPRQRADYKLKRILQIRNVVSMLEPSPSIEINQFSINPDFGYQNGSYNFIKSVSLAGEPDEALSKVSVFAVKGKMLSEIDRDTSPKRLVIVGDDEGQDRDVVREIGHVLSDNEVSFYSMQDVDPLVIDIRNNASKNGPNTTFS